MAVVVVGGGGGHGWTSGEVGNNECRASSCPLACDRKEGGGRMRKMERPQSPICGLLISSTVSGGGAGVTFIYWVSCSAAAAAAAEDSGLGRGGRRGRLRAQAKP